jgi:hypothetical protein
MGILDQNTGLFSGANNLKNFDFLRSLGVAQGASGINPSPIWSSLFNGAKSALGGLGSMNPWMLGAGVGMQGLASLLNGAPQFEDVNKSWMDLFNAQTGAPQANRDLNYQRSNAFYNQLMGSGALNPTNWLAKASGMGDQASGQIKAILDALKNGQYSPEAQLKSFLSQNPALANMAGQTADQSLMNGGQSFSALAEATARNNVDKMASQMGASGLLGGGSIGGAALSSLMRGAMVPLLQVQTQLAQLRQNSFMNAYSPAAQAFMNLLAAQPGQLLQGAGQLGIMAQFFGQQGSGLAGLLGDASQQQILAPNIQQKAGKWDWLGQIGGTLTGGGVGNMMNQNNLSNVSNMWKSLLNARDGLS